MTGDDLVSSMIEIPAIFVSKRSARVLEEARRLLSSEREVNNYPSLSSVLMLFCRVATLW